MSNAAMWQLYQFPLCPFSRKVRLALSEKGVAFDLVREDPWAASDEFYALNPAGRTPVLRVLRGNGRNLPADRRQCREPRRDPPPRRPVRRGVLR
jgi:glutaredoxin